MATVYDKPATDSRRVAGRGRRIGARATIDVAQTAPAVRVDGGLDAASTPHPRSDDSPDLEGVVRRKTRELEDERADLRRALDDLHAAQADLLQARKMEAIGQLAAGMAHEINTPIQYITDNVGFMKRAYAPLATIVGSVHALLAQYRVGHVDATLLSDLESAVRGARLDFLRGHVPAALDQSLDGLRRVATIVGAMKDYSHPPSAHREPVDLGEVIWNASRLTCNEWRYVAELEVKIDPDLPKVPCLRDEIGQVVLNLMVNAAHAVADAQGDRTHEKGWLVVSAYRAGAFAEIRVADSGGGIAVSIRDRVFDPFFTTKAVGRGTGQGLAICYSCVVDRHDGEIFFECDEGRGTTFVVRLPLSVRASEGVPCA